MSVLAWKIIAGLLLLVIISAFVAALPEQTRPSLYAPAPQVKYSYLKKFCMCFALNLAGLAMVSAFMYLIFLLISGDPFFWRQG